MPTKIAHISTVHKRTDTRIFVKELGSLAAALDAEVIFLVQDGLPDEVIGGVKIRSAGPKLSWQRYRFAIGIWRMLARVLREGATIVHFHDPELIPVGIILKALGKKVIYDVHEDVPKQLFHRGIKSLWLRYILSWAYLLFERIGMAVFDACFVVVPEMQARFRHGNTLLLANFPSLAEFPPPSPQPPPREPARFVYVGGLSLVRGLCEMIDAVGLVKDQSASLHLHGNFPNAGIEAAMGQRAGWTRVRFHGWGERGDVVGALSSATAGLVVLHPTPQYLIAYPVKLFEYMAAGLPVIASDFPLWREIVTGANCGLLVDPMNPAAIAKATDWMIEIPAEAAEMGRQGRRAVESRYNWETESVKLIDLYRRLIGHG